MYNIALIKGDGIGPELSEAAVSILSEHFNVTCDTPPPNQISINKVHE